MKEVNFKIPDSVLRDIKVDLNDKAEVFALDYVNQDFLKFKHYCLTDHAASIITSDKYFDMVDEILIFTPFFCEAARIIREKCKPNSEFVNTILAVNGLID